MKQLALQEDTSSERDARSMDASDFIRTSIDVLAEAYGKGVTVTPLALDRKWCRTVNLQEKTRERNRKRQTDRCAGRNTDRQRQQ